MGQFRSRWISGGRRFRYRRVDFCHLPIRVGPHTLGSPAADSFTIVSTTGQIRTKSGVTYDQETQSAYSVTVTADDGTGTATATISVMISVTDVPEPDPEPEPETDPDPEPKPDTVPAAPLNVTVTELDGIQPVTVSWEPVDGADTYTVWFLQGGTGRNYRELCTLSNRRGPMSLFS